MSMMMTRISMLLVMLLPTFNTVVGESLTTFPPTAHRCVWASNKLRKTGDGSTPGSCSNCDPTASTCSPGCQDLIDTVYWACAEIDMPDGYYFDPINELSGVWEDNLDTFKINVERCGCNSATRGLSGSLILVVFVTIVATLVMVF